MSLRNRLQFIIKNFIDYRIGLIGAIVMGGIVFYINFQNGELTGALTASFKQAGYTFLFGGSIMKICEHMATMVKPKLTALLLAVIIPSTISLGLTYGLHTIKGTPRPIESTIPTAILVVPSTLVWGIKKRRQIRGITN